jgi:hypothetical protein
MPVVESAVAPALLTLDIGGYGSRIGVRFAHLSGTTEVFMADAIFTAVIVRLDRTIQYAAASPFFSDGSGILDHLLEPVVGRRVAPTRWRAMTRGVRRDPSAVIASEAKQSILQLGETKDGLLRRKGSSQ